MMRNPLTTSAIIWTSLSAGATVQGAPGVSQIEGPDGLSFGQSPLAVEWLATADWMPSGCSRERRLYLADADRRSFLADVRLVWPGLVYRFFDDRLYAVEADYPPGEDAFAKLAAYLTDRYGEPCMTESWQGAPKDAFVYQHRLRTLGWYGPDGHRSIWLTNHTEGGTLTMIDDSIADLGMQEIDSACSPPPTRTAPPASGSATGRLAGD